MKNILYYAALLLLVCLIWLMFWAERVEISGLSSDGLQPEWTTGDCQGLAVSSLSSGASWTEFGSLGLEQQDSIIELLSTVFRTYLNGDFDAYEEFHGADMDCAQDVSGVSKGDFEHLVLSNFGVDLRNSPGNWKSRFREFWERLYVTPVMHEVFPGEARFELYHRDYGVEGFDAGQFYSDFEERRGGFVKRANHKMTVPHRRSLQEIVTTTESLTWFDFQIPVMLGDKASLPCDLLMRFVWDDIDGAWFMARSVTAYPDDYTLNIDPRSVLLF